MIRHIVLFRFKEDIGADRRQELAGALLGLKGKISLIRELEVGFDMGGKHNSYDLGLNSVFDSLDDVEEYAVHPEHVKVVEVVKEICQASVKVDYEY